MPVNVQGLLGAIGALPSVITKGLLGPLPSGQGLGLDPRQMQQAQQSAMTDMAMGMVAGGRDPRTLMMARQNATENYRGRVFDLLKEQEYKRMQGERETMDAQLAEYRKQNPDKAHLPDAILLKYMDPSFGLQESQLGLQQQQLAATLENNASDNARADAQLKLMQGQAAQSRANADRQYELDLMKIRADEQKYRASLKAQSGARPTEVQAKAGLFASRMSQVSPDIQDVAPSWKDYSLYATTLNSQGGTQALANKAINDKWLPHFNATRAFLAGILRQDTGAAITAEEYQQYYPTYFPMPGDTQAVIDQKRALRENEISRVTAVAEGRAEVATTPVIGMPSQSAIDAEIARRQQQGSWKSPIPMSPLFGGQ